MGRGESYDEAAYAETLRTTVADVVARQEQAGIDIVSDGEYGKANWISYLYDRISGVESRAIPAGETRLPPSRDRQAFPGAYAQARQGVRPRAARGRGAHAGAERVGLHRPGDLRPHRARSRHRQLQGRAAGEGRRGLPARRRAGQHLLAGERALRDGGGVRLRARRRPRGRVQRDRRRGPDAPGRRRGAHARVRLDPRRGRLDRGLPHVGPAPRGRAEPRAEGHPAGEGPLPHLLGQLARPARLRPAAAPTSSTSSCRSRPARTRWSRPTRATSTSGTCGRT